jgi:hypothetical protein
LAISKNINLAGLGIPAVCCPTFSRVSKIGFPAAEMSVSDECRSILLLLKITPRTFTVRVPEQGRHQSWQALAPPGLAVKDAFF